MPSAASTVFPPARVVLVGYEDQDNLGLRYLSSRLRQAGHQTRIVRFNKNPQSVFETVSAWDPHVVGFSLIFQYLVPEFRTLARALRDSGVACHFTMGGHYASFEFKALLCAIPQLDSVVRFEGEDTLVELAECLVQGRDWSDVAGIAFRRGDGIIEGPARTGRENLDELPWPDRDDINYGQYSIPTASMLGSRGCPWKCSFCSIITFYEGNGTKGRRRRSPVLVVDELEYLCRERGVRVILWQDDDFLAGGPGAIRWAHEIAEESIRRGLHRELRWKFSCRSDEVRAETLAPLVEAGLTHVYLGVEAGDPDDLKHMNKLLGPEVHLRAGEVLRRFDLSFDFGFMILEPWSTLASVRNNLSFLREFAGDGASVIGFCRMLPYVGTAVEARLRKEGRLISEDLFADYRFLDPRLDTLYSWLLETFSQRNFAVDGIQNILRLLLFEAHLRFPGQPDNELHREMIRCITSVSNQVTLETIESAVDRLESGSAGPDDPVLADLRRHYQEHDYRTRQDISLLLAARPAAEAFTHSTR